MVAQTKKKAPVLHLDKNLDVMLTHTHDISGCRLILAEITDAPAGGPRYVVDWMAPWQKTPVGCRLYKTLRAATLNYEWHRKDGNPPMDTASLKRDWQRKRVYDWYLRHLPKGRERLNEQKMQSVAKRLCRAFHVATAEVRLQKRKGGTEVNCYWPTDHKISMQSRDFISLTHEIAHAIHDQKFSEKSSPHGPGFMRVWLMVMAHCHWASLSDLEKSAERMGILVAPRLPALKHASALDLAA